mgnify:CR=1 FL=1
MSIHSSHTSRSQWNAELCSPWKLYHLDVNLCRKLWRVHANPSFYSSQVTATQSLERDWKERDANSSELLSGVKARLIRSCQLFIYYRS